MGNTLNIRKLNECIFSEETMDGKPRVSLDKGRNTFHKGFYDNSLCRFYLRHIFNSNNLKTITIILQNPSYANETGLDSTLYNIKKLLVASYKDVYSSFDVLNVFPIRTSDSGELRILLNDHAKFDKYQSQNSKIIQQHIEKAEYILLAWGSEHHQYAKRNIFPLLRNKKLFIFSDLNKDNSPPHFSSRVYNSKKNKVLREIKIEETTMSLKIVS